MSDLTITGLTSRQVVICEMLWRLHDWDEIFALVRAGGPEFQAMLNLMVAEQFDKVDEVDESVTDYLTRF